jgi:hypothetical protein
VYVLEVEGFLIMSPCQRLMSGLRGIFQDYVCVDVVVRGMD